MVYIYMALNRRLNFDMGTILTSIVLFLIRHEMEN